MRRTLRFLTSLGGRSLGDLGAPIRTVAYGLVLALVLMFGGMSRAEAQSRAVEIALTQQKVLTAANGKERLVDATNVLPGDVIEYRATYRNVSKGVVSGLAADLPIPEGLEYVAGSASPAAGVKAAAARSAAPGAFGVLPLVQKSPDGRVVAVPLTEYRVLRWSVAKLAPGAQLVVRARARVIALAQPAPAARKPAPQAPPKGAAGRP